VTLKERFDYFDEEFLKFTRIEHPRHPRPDLCAFLMLHDVVPAKPHNLGYLSDMVAGAEHDEIWLDTDCGAFATVATDDLIRDLVRCGVRYDEDVDSLAMFV
jgi:hypothetical protein